MLPFLQLSPNLCILMVANLNKSSRNSILKIISWEGKKYHTLENLWKMSQLSQNTSLMAVYYTTVTLMIKGRSSGEADVSGIRMFLVLGCWWGPTSFCMFRECTREGRRRWWSSLLLTWLSCWWRIWRSVWSWEVNDMTINQYHHMKYLNILLFYLYYNSEMTRSKSFIIFFINM